MSPNKPVTKAKSMYELAVEAEKSGVVDMRKPRGRRHRCALLIMMIMIGYLYGRLSIRSIGRLFHDPDYEQELKKLFQPYFVVDEFPSTSCLTRFLESCDTEGLAVYLCQWAYQLLNDDGVTLRIFGVDGQAVGASKLKKEGGRSKYNVDFHDLKGDILVYMEPVEAKSQESVMVEASIYDLLSGHPNVVLCGDAMMTKLGILKNVLKAHANGMFPVKRNNPKLMDAFLAVLEELCREGSPAVEHYVDLDGAADGVGSAILTNTECTFEEEDNKKNGDNPKSHPIREAAFFDGIYPYAYDAQEGQEITAMQENVSDGEASDNADEKENGTDKENCDSADGEFREEVDAEDASEEFTLTFFPGPGFEDSVVSMSPNARVVCESACAQTDGCETEDVNPTGDAKENDPPAEENHAEASVKPTVEAMKPDTSQLGSDSEPDAQQDSANPVAEGRERKAPVVDPDAKGKWVKYGDRLVVCAPSHGRLERREFELITDPGSCDIWKYVPEKLREKWEPYVQTIGIATRYRAEEVEITRGKGKAKQKKVVYKGTITKTVYMFTWVPDSAEEAEQLVREYWGIEGKLHGVADRLLQQDACSCRVGNSTGNVSLMRKVAYNVLSCVRNAAKSECGKDVAYVSALEKIGNDFRYIFDLLFKEPSKAMVEFVRNHCPATN